MEDTSTWTTADWDAWEDTLTEPTEYAPEPKLNGVDSAVLFAKFGGSVMSVSHETPHGVEATLKYCREQHAHCDPPPPYKPDWHNDCQAFCHCAWGLFTGGEPSAYAQWLALTTKQRHRTGDTGSAPLGSLLFSKGATPFGHVMVSARRFKSGTPAAWSTDLRKIGQVGKVARTAPHTAWGHTILGWGTAINGVDLDLSQKEK